MRVTVSQFAASEGITKVEANAILKFLARKEFAKQATLNVPNRGKGRPANVFTMRKAGHLTVA